MKSLIQCFNHFQGILFLNIQLEFNKNKFIIIRSLLGVIEGKNRRFVGDSGVHNLSISLTVRGSWYRGGWRTSSANVRWLLGYGGVSDLKFGDKIKDLNLRSRWLSLLVYEASVKRYGIIVDAHPFSRWTPFALVAIVEEIIVMYFTNKQFSWILRIILWKQFKQNKWILFWGQQYEE